MIGSATGTKSGLLRAGNLTYISAHNYGLYRIIEMKAIWQRKTAIIKGSYNATPIDIIVGTYGSANVNNFSCIVTAVTPIPSHIKFYKKNNELFVFFNANEGDLNFVWITADSLVEQISVGDSNIIDSTYSEVK